jgi:hypothetical protein
MVSEPRQGMRCPSLPNNLTGDHPSSPPFLRGRVLPDRPTVNRALDDGPSEVDGAAVSSINRATDHPANDTGDNLFQGLLITCSKGFSAPPAKCKPIGYHRSVGKSCEQLRAGWRELHVGATLVQP